ncbi:energy-coupling factor transporter transmembrane protein EcfT [Paenalcaligenes niemegkensis]|uniref:energy-coupling factor transporter transmembrane protein EcfT n=1 Tax=Paenalcaligenes niemegkensis TaxID=2895469 RepID=UPI001EE8036E|nr:energy-coupling factor transporter transmembrane protein EcfT [Paenalcaligenes niemegkensis]MCQ9617577.1 energy-coupling factor transporter transmembrane protein EcfT [Paenalcaligenes niemegkensis]
MGLGIADSRLRIGLAFAGSLAVVLATDLLRVAIVALALLPLSVWVYRDQLKTLFKRLLPANLLLFFLFAFVAVDWRAWQWVEPGYSLALLAVARANAAMLLCAACLKGLSAESIAGAVADISRSKKFALLSFLMVRYLAEFQQSRDRLERSLSVRAFVARPSRHVYKSYGIFFARLLLDGLDRATSVSRAMQARSYNGIFLYRQKKRFYGLIGTVFLRCFCLFC